MTVMYQQPRPMAKSDAISQFECRSREQTDWIRNHARLASTSGTAQVQVITPESSDKVVAYYAWCMSSIPKDKLLQRWRKGAGKYDQPVVLLARLATSRQHERRGLGTALLQDVLRRTANIASEIGCRGLLVHAESKDACDFYTRAVSAFEASPTGDLHLVLLMKDIKRTLNN